MPSPPVADGDRHWARVRIGLRDADIRYLAPLLDTIRRQAEDNPHWDVRVQVVPERGPRAITASGSATPAATAHPLLACDIDVVGEAGSDDSESESDHARDWRVLALCADARSNIENDVLNWLTDQTKQGGLCLAAVTFAILHGKSIILMLGHQPGGQAAGESLPKPDGACARAHLQVLVDEWQSKVELGSAGPESLLRVQIRSQDRPGALLDVLRSLDRTLSEELQLTPEGPQISVWHALNQVVQGQVAYSRLTIRIPAGHGGIEAWDDSKIKDIERAVRQEAAASEAAAARTSPNPFSDGLGAGADPVITINLIKAPARTD